jgi:hypothetical protein
MVSSQCQSRNAFATNFWFLQVIRVILIEVNFYRLKICGSVKNEKYIKLFKHI